MKRGRSVVVAIVLGTAALWGPVAPREGGPGGGAPPAGVPDPQEIVRRADDIRNPSLGYSVDVRITSAAGRRKETSLYRVYIKGRDRSFVEFLEPAHSRGMALLMAGEDSWLYLPGIGRATRISSYQGLTGQVANGDIARLNFLEDYDALGVALESPEGRRTYRVELRARRRSATYHRVTLWVEAETCRPVRAEFFAVSGRLLKRGEYGDYREVLGAIRPTRLTLEDATLAGARSIMEFGNFRVKDLPDKMFTRSYVSRPR